MAWATDSSASRRTTRNKSAPFVSIRAASRPFAVKTSIQILQKAAKVAENTSCPQCLVVNQIRVHSRRFAGNNQVSDFCRWPSWQKSKHDVFLTSPWFRLRRVGKNRTVHFILN
jgi:hypothetical protein